MSYDKTPFFTVITPSWNRAVLLERVKNGLMRQRFRNFEWIIADDGSEDNTAEVVKKFFIDCNFDILYLKADIRVGKARMDNEAIKRSRGTLAIWCDSDDVLLPNALEKFHLMWKEIPIDQQKNFSGMTAIASTESGDILNPFDQKEDFDTTWNQIFGQMTAGSKTQDMTLCIRTCLLKTNLFPEEDFVIPEGVVWTKIGHMKAKTTSLSVKKVEYGHPNAISYSGKMEYNRGRAIALAQIFSEMSFYDKRLRYTLVNTVHFIRYAIHGNINLLDAYNMWRANVTTIIFLVTLPVAIILCIIDRLQGKVVKTHLNFLQNTNKAAIRTERNWS